MPAMNFSRLLFMSLWGASPIANFSGSGLYKYEGSVAVTFL